jgi:integrase
MAPRFLDSEQALKVKPITLERYRTQASHFVAWARGQHFHPVSAEDWDDVLVEYKNANTPMLTRAKFTTLIAAVEFFFPHFRSKLNWAHSVVSGWTAGNPIKHAVPLGKMPAKLLGMHMAHMGHARLGLGLILQSTTGMRPGEMLGITTFDFTFPEDMGSTLEERPLVIALAPRTGTKVKRPQVVMLPALHANLVALLRALRAQTPPGERLFPQSHLTYRNIIAMIDRRLGIQANWTPHSPRAGFASDGKAEGVPFQELREQGRWQSDSSLRTYLDVVAASAILQDFCALGLAPALSYANTHWPESFSAAAFAQTYQQRSLCRPRVA